MFKVEAITTSEVWTKGDRFEVEDEKYSCCTNDLLYFIPAIQRISSCTVCHRDDGSWWNAKCFRRIDDNEISNYSIEELMEELSPEPLEV